VRLIVAKASKSYLTTDQTLFDFKPYSEIRARTFRQNLNFYFEPYNFMAANVGKHFLTQMATL